MIHKTTILGAILLNIIFIFLGIWLSTYFFILVGINIVLLIPPVVRAIKEQNLTAWSNRMNKSDAIFEKCKKQNNNKQLLIMAMAEVSKLDAIVKPNWIIKIASEDLKRDKEFLLEAINYTNELPDNIGEELMNDKDFLLEASKNAPISIVHIGEKLKYDMDFLKLLWKDDSYYISSLIEFDCKKNNNNREFLLFAMQTLEVNTEIGIDASRVMAIASNKLKNDKDFILKAIKFNTISISQIGKELKQDIEFMNEIKKAKRANKN